jgi:1-phosphatidylinositol-4-phosphate 5-kinase
VSFLTHALKNFNCVIHLSPDGYLQPQPVLPSPKPPSVGNKLMPSAKYDFKFKDYAPWYSANCAKTTSIWTPWTTSSPSPPNTSSILFELSSPDKSGSFFHFSYDYCFIIKTIRHSEHKFLLSILKDYHKHVKNNPHTLLSRFYGLGQKIHFVIMNNLFLPHRDIHKTYDLKGSTVGRECPEEKAARNLWAVLKDLIGLIAGICRRRGRY